MNERIRYELRPKPGGKFDELLVYDKEGECIVHLEMMSDATLWGAFYTPGSQERVCIWATAEKGKLRVSTEEPRAAQSQKVGG